MVYSPDANKDVAQLANEVAYLREENNDLRRQLYALRYARGESTSSGMVPPASAGDPQGKVTTGIWPEVKQEGAYVYSTPVVSSPRVASSHGRTMSHPGDFVRVSRSRAWGNFDSRRWNSSLTDSRRLRHSLHTFPPHPSLGQIPVRRTRRSDTNRPCTRPRRRTRCRGRPSDRADRRPRPTSSSNRCMSLSTPREKSHGVRT